MKRAWAEPLPRLSPEQSLASISAASGGASAAEWEQNGPDCGGGVGGGALARDHAHPKPPLILDCSPTPAQIPENVTAEALRRR